MDPEPSSQQAILSESTVPIVSPSPKIAVDAASTSTACEIIEETQNVGNEAMPCGLTDEPKNIGNEPMPCELTDEPKNIDNEFTPSPVPLPVAPAPAKAIRPLTQHSKDKFAVKGMAFLLQQMRSSASAAKSTAPVTSNNNSTESAERKRKLSDDSCLAATHAEEHVDQLGIPKLSSPIDYAFTGNFPPNLDAVDNCGGSAGGEPITINVEPFEVVRDCFRSKTTPNFCFSEKITDNNYVRSCKWRPDGAMLLAESEDRRVRIFRFEEEKQLRLVATMRSGDLIYDVQWHPHRDLFATTSRESPIHLWNSEGRVKLSFRGINHLDELASAYSMAFSLDGLTLYAGYYKMLRIFNLERPGRHIRELKTFEKGSFASGQKAILSCITACPTMNGVYAVGCFGGKVGLYSDHTGACDCLFQTESPGVTHLQYSSDGKLLFTGCRKSSVIECFDLRFPVKVLSTFYRPAETNQRFHFQLDRFDRYLFSGSSTGSILIHELKLNNHQSDATLKESLRPSWIIPSSKAAVTGLSVHPTAPIIAATSGQCVFPRPLLTRNSSDKCSNSSSDESCAEEEKNFAPADELFRRWDSRAPLRQYAECTSSDSLDNSLKLWRI